MRIVGPDWAIETVGHASPRSIGEGLATLTSVGESSPAPLFPDLGTLALAGIIAGLLIVAGLQALYTLLRDEHEPGVVERR